jgi:ribonuclease HI
MRKILTNQTLGVILMELHKTIDVGEEGFSFYQIHTIFPLTFGLGTRSNNYAELMSLKLLIAFAIENECHSFIVFGDSMNVINWIRGT